MAQIGIVFGSTTGNTAKYADMMQQQLGKDRADLLDIAKTDAGDLEPYPYLILGTSTWGFGDLQDDWESKVAILKKINWQGKKVALFGLGDQEAYASTFLDAMGTLYETLLEADATCIGTWSTEGYTFDESTAVKNNRFVGLALDEENQEDKMKTRIMDWLAQLEDEWKS
jgi:flavodoxin I